MKRFIIITILATIAGMTAMAQDRPDVTHQTTGGDRIDITTVNVSRPVLTYDAEEQEITVRGFADFYIVEVTLANDDALIHSTVVEGDMGVIDASMLVGGVYDITLINNSLHFKYAFDGTIGKLTFMNIGGNSLKPNSQLVIDKNTR